MQLRITSDVTSGDLFCFCYFKNICFVSLLQGYPFLWHNPVCHCSFIAWSVAAEWQRPHAGREAAESDKRYWPDKIMMKYREHWSCLFERKLTYGAAVTYQCQSCIYQSGMAEVEFGLWLPVYEELDTMLWCPAQFVYVGVVQKFFSALRTPLF